MSAYNVKHVRIDPYGITSAGPDTILDFNIPQGGFIDLSSLAMLFTFTINAGSKMLSKDAESVIQTLEVFVNGQLVNKINNYQQAFRVLSDYAFDANETVFRGTYRNCMVNGNPASASWTNSTFCCTKWLGWLGSGAIVDTSKNAIHIRITVSPRFIISSATGTDTFTMSNVRMRAIFYQKYEGELQTTFTYPEFASTMQVFGSNAYMESTLKVISDNVDYVFGFNTDSSALSGLTSTTADGLTRFFFRRSQSVDSWNMKVNGKLIFPGDLSAVEGQIIARTVFPNGMQNIGNVVGTSASTIAMTTGLDQGLVPNIKFIACSPIKFKSDTMEEVEISFYTRGSGYTNIPQYLFIKYDKTLTLRS